MEGRTGAFSLTSLKSKLEGYRDLFLKSGAWQRMVNHFDAQSSKPKYVSDLTHEIECIEAWYVDRLYEMDAYFGLTETDTDGIDEIKSEELRMKNEGAIYDLSGRQIVNSKSSNRKLPRGLYIQNGKKVFILQ